MARAADLFTYDDVLSALDDFAREHMAGHSTSAMRRNILDAYRDIAAEHDWSFLLMPGRVKVVAQQTTGTVVYDHTGGGTCERQLTLTDATWPTDAADYCVRFNDIVCDIERYLSPAVVQLDAVMNPQQDVSSTTYACYPRYYTLPADFMCMAATQDEDEDWRLGTEISMNEMHARLRWETDTGNTRRYAVGNAPDLHGVMALYIDPPTDATETLDFLYKRQMRPLRYTGRETNDRVGTATFTADDADVSGTDTVFSSSHIGSIIRTAGNDTWPTGLEGSNPWVEQRSIIDVTSATALTMDAVAASSYSGKKYVITDPLDMNTAAYSAFLWLCKVYLCSERKPKELVKFEAAYQRALKRSRRADHRSRQVVSCMPPSLNSVKRRRDFVQNKAEE